MIRRQTVATTPGSTGGSGRRGAIIRRVPEVCPTFTIGPTSPLAGIGEHAAVALVLNEARISVPPKG